MEEETTLKKMTPKSVTGKLRTEVTPDSLKGSKTDIHRKLGREELK